MIKPEKTVEQLVRLTPEWQTGSDAQKDKAYAKFKSQWERSQCYPSPPETTPISAYHEWNRFWDHVDKNALGVDIFLLITEYLLYDL